MIIESMSRLLVNFLRRHGGRLSAARAPRISNAFAPLPCQGQCCGVFFLTWLLPLTQATMPNYVLTLLLATHFSKNVSCLGKARSGYPTLPTVLWHNYLLGDRSAIARRIDRFAGHGKGLN